MYNGCYNAESVTHILNENIHEIGSIEKKWRKTKGINV